MMHCASELAVLLASCDPVWLREASAVSSAPCTPTAQSANQSRPAQTAASGDVNATRQAERKSTQRTSSTKSHGGPPEPKPVPASGSFDGSGSHPQSARRLEVEEKGRDETSDGGTGGVLANGTGFTAALPVPARRQSIL